MGISATGSIFIKDEYDQFYKSEWETIDGDLDITTTIMQPFVWGMQDHGYVKNNIHYKYGIITIIRQILRFENDGYTIIAEGSSQYLDYIQMNFPCGGGPKDNFKHHLDHYTVDEVSNYTSTDSWMKVGDFSSVWGDVPPAPTVGEMNWVNVWA